MSGSTVRVITTGKSRSGIAAKTGKGYTMAEAYAQLPGVPFPQKFTYYCASLSEVVPAGEYECDVDLDIKDDRFTVNVDPRKGRRVAATAAAPARATA
jgi:hypothetical protein